jgi:glycosyltransferase involved in cell wall biosynthesis
MTDFFNYIIPIFNKEDVLPLTLEGIDRCASQSSRIYTIIDGCTDRSEQVVDEFIKRTKRDVVKIHMPNVHMLRSVNAALAQVEHGFSIVMQDDIVIEDIEFEEKISTLYRNMGKRLGVVSLRLAANVAPTPLFHRLRMNSIFPMIEEIDFIMSPDDTQSYIMGNYGCFYPRMDAINGPNVIPWSVRQKIGIFDEALAPYGYDDPEYCLRAMKAGFINGLFPLKYRSDIEWGGTRRSKKFLEEVRRIHCRNRKYVWSKHGDYIDWLWKTKKVLFGTEPVDTLDTIPDCQRSA